MRAKTILLLILPCFTLSAEVCLPVAEAAQTAGFDPRIVAFGESREQIKSTPIEQRPYRPLHVYGNTVRRRQSRAVHPGPRSSGQR